MVDKLMWLKCIHVCCIVGAVELKASCGCTGSGVGSL